MPIGELFSPVMHTKGFLGLVDRLWMGINRLGIIFSIITLFAVIVIVIILYPTVKKNGYIGKAKNIILDNIKSYKSMYQSLKDPETIIG